MKIHKVYRDGKLFDEIDSETRHVKQIVASYANDHQDQTFVVHDENDVPYYEVVVRTKKSWKVHNGPFTTERDL